MKLLIATSNLGKYRELQGLLRLPGVRLCWLADFPPVAPADEEGRSFAQNARLKAAHYHQLLRLPVVADDSGLQVERLGGQPGVHSARYAGVGAGDRANLEKLLRDLQRDLSGASRRRLLSPARFVCALSLFACGRERFSAEGRCEGFITSRPKGENGFGYDPVFFLPAEGKTLAELDQRAKNRISHRAAAARQLRRFLSENLPELLALECDARGRP